MAGASMLRVTAFQEVGGFSERLWLGGEEELLSLDLAAAGWWMCWAEDVIVHHQASAARDARARRILGVRNTLWTAWLRLPVWDALHRTWAVLLSIPRDAASARAVGLALAGVPWVRTERRVVPGHVAAGLRLLREPQRTSRARRYVG